jgi:hypothetical protein
MEALYLIVYASRQAKEGGKDGNQRLAVTVHDEEIRETSNVVHRASFDVLCEILPILTLGNSAVLLRLCTALRANCALSR